MAYQICQKCKFAYNDAYHESMCPHMRLDTGVTNSTTQDYRTEHKITDNPYIPKEGWERMYHRIIDGVEYILGIDVSKNGEDKSRHTLVGRDGTTGYCGGPGKCKWCDKENYARDNGKSDR